MAEHVQNEVLKLNRTTLENRIIVVEDATSTRKKGTQNLQKTFKRTLVVIGKHPENQDVFNSWKLECWNYSIERKEKNLAL